MKKSLAVCGIIGLLILAALTGVLLAKNYIANENQKEAAISYQQLNSNKESGEKSQAGKTSDKKEESSNKKEESSNKKEESNENSLEESGQQNLNDIKNSIKIIRAYPSEPNSAGGVDLNIIWKNISSKTIKYVSFEVVPYNAVEDVVECTIRHKSNFRGRITGPIAPNQTYGDETYWDCAWYNNTIIRVQIIGAEITYMDGTNVIISNDNIKYILN